MDTDTKWTLPQAMQQAVTAYSTGEWAKAEQLARFILNVQADHSEALNLLGIMAAQRGQLEEAANLLGRVVAARPGEAVAHSNYGNVLNDLRRFEDALNSYAQALKLNPDFAEAHYNRGIALAQLQRFEEALGSYARALKIRPPYAEAHNNRGKALHELKRFEEALGSYAQALKINPRFAEAYNNRGATLQELKRFEEALDSYAQALKIKPDFAQTYFNLGIVLQELKRLEEALGSYAQALKINPRYAKAYNNRGIVLQELKRFEEALDSYAQALKINPDFAEAYNNRGSALRELKRFEDALDSYTHALAINPDCDWLLGSWLHTKMQLCDWSDFDSQLAQLAAHIQRAQRTAEPLAVLSLSDSLSLQRQAAQTYVSEKYPPSRLLPAIAKRARHERIRVGYFSGDYRIHPVSLLSAELFERHDRAGFEVIAFSFGPDTQDPMRQRLEQAFDRFIDVSRMSDPDIVQLARSMELDIAVDLGGFTAGGRPNLFALRAAPLQVSYLGYPGTTSAEYIDYLVADRTIIPEGSEHHYSEKIVYLPNSYLPNDSTRRIADKVSTREESGLPPSGFIFCCFNSAYKITPGTFESWMRILRRVENSVLWLSVDNPTAASNLQRQAQKSGVAAQRIIFAQRLEGLPEHLARLRIADLFLDTLPYNAHATAMDALWAGLPLLTCMGETFAGRVAASLLRAVDLPQLVTTTQGQYEATAIELAGDPARLAQLKDRLHRNRLLKPLFDTTLLGRHLENAYTQMYGRYHADLSPENIDVPAG